jgi:glycosyltransferase involved in cell wall biosynthesis
MALYRKPQLLITFYRRGGPTDMPYGRRFTFSTSNRPIREESILFVGNFLSHVPQRTRHVGEDLAARLIDSGRPVLTTSHKLARLPRLLDMVSTIWLKRRKYAVAHVDVFSGDAFLWAEAACRTLRYVGKPFVLTLHGGKLPDFARRHPHRVRNLLNSAVAVTTPSRYLFEQMAQYRADLLLQPNALDLSAYRFRLRVHPRPDLVWLRAFCKIYNPSLAPRVLAQLAKDFPEVNLTMIGPDKGDGSLQAMREVATVAGVTGRITLPGKVSKSAVPAFLDKADLFLNTTNVDNTPVSVMEAMACGLCVVSTNIGGIPYLLEHEQEALLVPPNNPEAMAFAVQRILTEPGLAEHLSRNGRRKVEQFDWPVVLPQWERLLGKVAGMNIRLRRK